MRPLFKLVHRTLTSSAVGEHPAVGPLSWQEVRTVAAAAPAITALSWGSVSTEAGTFRDAKLWPGGGRAWDWNETGTSHEPGVQPADVAELLDRGARVVVLGRGQHGRLQVTDEALATIRRAGARAEVLETPAAVRRYNVLAAGGEPVGALIHSTC